MPGDVFFSIVPFFSIIPFFSSLWTPHNSPFPFCFVWIATPAVPYSIFSNRSLTVPPFRGPGVCRR